MCLAILDILHATRFQGFHYIYTHIVFCKGLVGLRYDRYDLYACIHVYLLLRTFTCTE